MTMPTDAADKVDGSPFGFQSANNIKNHFYTAEAVSDPPTDAELDALFTSPASVPPGCLIALKNTSSAGAAYLIYSDGTSWHVFTGVLAT